MDDPIEAAEPRTSGDTGGQPPDPDEGGGGPTTPTMPNVTYPITGASVAAKVTTAGATILVLAFGVAIAFVLIRKLYRRIIRPL